MEPTPPEFSIVVPTYRRPELLRGLLCALAELDYPRTRFEVIVVDDGGGLETVVLAPFREQLLLRLVSQANAGPASARNTGASRAEGRYLAFTDDDCAPSRGWLQALAAHFAEHPECGAGGRTVNALSKNLYSSASQLLLDYVYDYHNPEPEHATFFASNNLTVPVSGFRALGGFDTSFPRAAAEDREFCDRWVQHGHGLRLVPEALVYHAHGLSLGSYVRQHFNYGVGAYRYHAVRADRGCGSFRPDLSFYLDLLRYPFRRARWTQAGRLASLFAIAQGATVAGFVHERRTAAGNRRDRAGLRLDGGQPARPGAKSDCASEFCAGETLGHGR